MWCPTLELVVIVLSCTHLGTSRTAGPYNPARLEARTLAFVAVVESTPLELGLGSSMYFVEDPMPALG